MVYHHKPKHLIQCSGRADCPAHVEPPQANPNRDLDHHHMFSPLNLMKSSLITLLPLPSWNRRPHTEISSLSLAVSPLVSLPRTHNSARLLPSPEILSNSRFRPWRTAYELQPKEAHKAMRSSEVTRRREEKCNEAWQWQSHHLSAQSIWA